MTIPDLNVFLTTLAKTPVVLERLVAELTPLLGGTCVGDAQPPNQLPDVLAAAEQFPGLLERVRVLENCLTGGAAAAGGASAAPVPGGDRLCPRRAANRPPSCSRSRACTSC